jgi:hypothetical protein
VVLWPARMSVDRQSQHACTPVRFLYAACSRDGKSGAPR